MIKDARSLRRKLLEKYGWTSFGETVRAARIEKGYTLEAVANKIGTHKGYISGIESGKVNPPAAKMIEKYALFLGLSSSALTIIAWAEKAPITILKQAVGLVREQELRALARPAIR
jgi:transcriptional regulator with XRE-family HTH domain